MSGVYPQKLCFAVSNCSPDAKDVYDLNINELKKERLAANTSKETQRCRDCDTCPPKPLNTRPRRACYSRHRWFSSGAKSCCRANSPAETSLTRDSSTDHSSGIFIQSPALCQFLCSLTKLRPLSQPNNNVLVPKSDTANSASVQRIVVRDDGQPSRVDDFLRQINAGREISCIMCGKSFTKGQLLRHVAEGHFDTYRPFGCTECDFRTADLEILTSVHLLDHHPKADVENYRICGKRNEHMESIIRMVYQHSLDARGSDAAKRDILRELELKGHPQDASPAKLHELESSKSPTMLIETEIQYTSSSSNINIGQIDVSPQENEEHSLNPGELELIDKIGCRVEVSSSQMTQCDSSDLFIRLRRKSQAEWTVTGSPSKCPKKTVTPLGSRDILIQEQGRVALEGLEDLTNATTSLEGAKNETPKRRRVRRRRSRKQITPTEEHAYPKKCNCVRKQITPTEEHAYPKKCNCVRKQITPTEEHAYPKKCNCVTSDNTVNDSLMKLLS